MPGRSFPGNTVCSNEREPVWLDCKFTGAADVDANGYTINRNPGTFVASVAKAAEGIITVTLADKYARFLNAVVSCSLDDYTFTLDAETVATNKTVTITCRTGGADTDPDSGVFHLSLRLAKV